MNKTLFTIPVLATIFGVDPRTVRKRIEALGLGPEKNESGKNYYNASLVARSLFSASSKKGAYDVAELSPKERAEHFMAEKRELEVLTMKRELIPYDEAAEKFADLARAFAKFFETFADDLEQTQLFTLEQMIEIRDLSDDQRIAFYNAEFS